MIDGETNPSASVAHSVNKGSKARFDFVAPLLIISASSFVESQVDMLNQSRDGLPINAWLIMR
jgi:hypothetical protein